MLMLLRIEMKCHYRSVHLTSTGRHSEKKSRRKRQRACAANFCINYAGGLFRMTMLLLSDFGIAASPYIVTLAYAIAAEADTPPERCFTSKQHCVIDRSACSSLTPLTTSFLLHLINFKRHFTALNFD